MIVEYFFFKLEKKEEKKKKLNIKIKGFFN